MSVALRDPRPRAKPPARKPAAPPFDPLDLLVELEEDDREEREPMDVRLVGSMILTFFITIASLGYLLLKLVGY